MRSVRGGVELTGSVAGGGGGGHPGLWRTPTPYLFLGFAVMMGLIAVALVVLVCTRRKPGSGSSRRGGGGGGAAADEAAARALVALDREPPKVAVMPGGAKLYFLASAKPLALAPTAAAAAAQAGDGAA